MHKNSTEVNYGVVDVDNYIDNSSDNLVHNEGKPDTSLITKEINKSSATLMTEPDVDEPMGPSESRI